VEQTGLRVKAVGRPLGVWRRKTLAAGTARRRGVSACPSVRSIEEWMGLATLRLVTGGWSGGGGNGCGFGAVCRARVGAARRRRGNGSKYRYAVCCERTACLTTRTLTRK
jgi:hypothetical protein